MRSDIATLGLTALSSRYMFVYVCFFMDLLIFCGCSKATVLALTQCGCSYLASESDGSLENNNITEARGEKVSNHMHKHPHTANWIPLWSCALPFIPFVILILSHQRIAHNIHQGVRDIFFHKRRKLRGSEVLPLLVFFSWHTEPPAKIQMHIGMLKLTENDDWAWSVDHACQIHQSQARPSCIRVRCIISLIFCSLFTYLYFLIFYIQGTLSSSYTE